MRGVVIGRSPKGLTLIRSLLNRSLQLSSFAGKPLTIQEDNERGAKEEEEEAIKERIRNVFAFPYPDSVCTKEQKEELARIARTVPETATALLKEYTVYVLLKLQSTDRLDFEDKKRIMHETIEKVSRGRVEEEEQEEKERIRAETVCTKEQKEELARIGKTVPESASQAAKEYAEYVSIVLQNNEKYNFEEKITMLHEAIEYVSKGFFK